MIVVSAGVGTRSFGFRPSATLVASLAALTSGVSHSCTAAAMFDESVRRSAYPVSPWICVWKK